MRLAALYRLLTLSLFYPFVLFTSPVAAIGVPQASTCGSACRLALSHQNFADTDTNLGYYPIQCGSDLRILSTFVCMRSHCTPSSITPGWKILNAECERYANLTLLDYESVVRNVTNDQVNGWLQIDTDDFNGGPSFTAPVSVSATLYQLAYDTKKAWNDSVSTREAYGHALIYFWALVILIGTLQRLLPNPLPLPCNLKRLLHLHITLPTIPSSHSHPPSSPSWLTPRPLPVPHTLLLTLFLLLNLLLSLTTYPTISPTNLYWPPQTQRLRYLSDRTGVLATCNLPLLWLFSTRNSLVLFLTNWSFDTAMVFHRWIARVATLQALVHSVGYAVLVVEGQGWAGLVAEMGLRYWVAGVLGMGTMAGAWVGSGAWVRGGWYEVFLVGHVVMAVGVVWGMWWHVDIFEGGGYLVYLWVCVVVWVGDRVVRLLKVVWANGDLLGNGAEVVWVEGARVVLLDVPVREGTKVEPGVYYFVYLLHGTGFWESHPFTVASWSEADSKYQRLKFLVRPYDGFTRRLADLARRPAGGITRAAGKVRILVEGTYGPARDLTRYDELVFVVGGSGVAVALAYLTDFIQLLRSRHGDEDDDDGPPRPKKYRANRITVVWMVKTTAMFDVVWRSHIQPLLEPIIPSVDTDGLSVRLDFQIHVTGDPIRSEADDVPVCGFGGHHHNHPPQQQQQQDWAAQSEHSPLLSPAHSTSSSASGSSTPTAVLPSPSASSTPPRYPHATRTTSASLLRRPSDSRGGGGGGHSAHTPMPSLYGDGTENGGSESDNGLAVTHTIEYHGNHRPDVSTTLNATYTSGARCVAVVSCGPHSLAAATREAVRDILEARSGNATTESEDKERKGERSAELDYWEESYSW